MTGRKIATFLQIATQMYKYWKTTLKHLLFDNHNIKHIRVRLSFKITFLKTLFLKVFLQYTYVYRNAFAVLGYLIFNLNSKLIII